jgi:hypothetical protein
MSTFIREPFPEAKKLSKSNVAMWTHYMQYKMMDWLDLRSAIQNEHKYVIERSNRDSCWSGTSILNPLDLTALEPASMERWARDMDRYHWEIDYRKIIGIYRNFDGKLLHSCFTTVSEVFLELIAPLRPFQRCFGS